MVHCAVSASSSGVLRFTALFIKVSSYVASAPQCSIVGFCICQEEVVFLIILHGNILTERFL